ncbi:T9SS type A sorting domain-containing protein [Tenacibaculum sp.]|uniref:T9SS type A sorting domain-containing protein n=1 Tax=Tenacibaculum sp. TaxID=1906242 RepID=UPI003AA87A4F
MRNKIILTLSILTFVSMNSQIERNLGAKSALQKSEFIRTVPQESNGYLVMHKNSRVDYWIINVILDKEIIKTYKTGSGENYIKIGKDIYNNWAYSYKILGISKTNTTILNIDAMPINGDPVWIYNNCNRPTCVKTSGGDNYAYGMEIIENVNNNSYKLKLRKAWDYFDEEEGIQVPYYIEVSANNLSSALIDQYHSYSQGESPQTYFFDNGMYKVALGMGPWKNDLNVLTNQINGYAGEGCDLSFIAALNRMNAHASLSSPLTCNGQQYSQNESGGGVDNPFGIYASTSTNILDCVLYLMDYNSELSYIDENGIPHYVWVLNSTSISLDDCNGEPTTTSPCPPGYIYSPGGGDPCKPMEPIIRDLKAISLTPIDVPSQGEGDTVEKGLYLMVFNYGEGISIPIYKKIENKISLKENNTSDINELTISPNPVKNELTIRLEDENIISYSIFDHLGNKIKKVELSLKSKQQILDLSQLKKGVYILNIKSDSNKFTEKIIKE